MPYLGNFGLKFKKTGRKWNQDLQICLISIFCDKTESPKFGSKNILFRYFWAGIWKIYCHISNQPLKICLLAKFREIIKMPKFGTKTALFEYFWAGIWKRHCHILNQDSGICLIVKFHEIMKMPKIETKMPNLGIFRLCF